MKDIAVKRRAKWGSKTRHGKPVAPSDGTLRPYVAENVRPRLPKTENGHLHKQLESAKIVFATMIIEGQDKSWSPFIRDTVKNILF